MITTWQPKNNYYIKLPIIKLQEVLDEMLVDILKYRKTKTWILEEVCRGVKYLENDEVAISIQLSNSQWLEHKLKDGSVINAKGVIDFIDEEDFNLAKYYFQVDEFLSQEEYNKLNNINMQ